MPNSSVISIKSASYIKKARFWRRSFIVSLIINIGLAIRIILTTITV